jgi:DNA polymerase III alpha subunit
MKFIDFVEKRSFLAGNIDTLLENLNARRESNKNPSEDIFGGFDEDEASKIAWKNDSNKMSRLEVLQSEKESLGVYMHGNPLEGFAELEEMARETSQLGQNLHIAVIEKIRKVMTKAHALMYALELSTTTGEMEGVIYTKKAPLYSSILAEKKLYYIQGRIDDRQKQATPEEVIPPIVMPVENNDIDDDEPAEMIDLNSAPIQEYQDNPKIVIDHLALFELGLPNFMQGVEEKVYGNGKYKKKETKAEEVFQEREEAKTATLYFSPKVDASVLKKVKEELKKGEGDINVEVFVLKDGEFKKAKGDFRLQSEFYKSLPLEIRYV